MRVLIFHGYLLRGTGSNVYNAALGEALVRAGHELHLLCQDRDPLALPWVDAAADWDGGELRVEVRREPVRATVYRPDIGGLLPVYVADRYEGVEARPFQDLSEEEVAAYVERNVAAVRDVVARARPDVALANHLVMGPLVLARALGGRGALRGEDPRQRAGVHGQAASALPARRRGGHRAARAGVLVGSRHTGRACGRRWPSPGLEARTRLGPPGRRRRALRAARARAAAAEGMAALADAARRRWRRPRRAAPRSTATRARRPPRWRALDPRRDRIVAYVGKLIGSKGVELLLAAFPLVLARAPGRAAARRRLRRASAAGSRSSRTRSRAATSPRPARCAARTGRSCRTSRRSSTRSTARRYAALARATAGRVHWAGRLEHEELTDVLPAAEAFAMPSTFPEAFGMVAAEAAACGVLPGRRRALRDGRGRALAGRGGRARGRAVAHVRGRPGRGGGARGRPRELARGARRSCARARARRSSAWRASATRGTASRAP